MKRFAIRTLACVAVLSLSGSASAQDYFSGHFAQTSGEAVFKNICQGCHMPNAQGAVGAGHYPALANNPKLVESGYPVMMVMNGNKTPPQTRTRLSPRPSAAFCLAFGLSGASVASTRSFSRSSTASTVSPSSGTAYAAAAIRTFMFTPTPAEAPQNLGHRMFLTTKPLRSVARCSKPGLSVEEPRHRQVPQQQPGRGRSPHRVR